MRFCPYHRIGNTPNLIVDGQSNAATVLNLSHWPHSGTPPLLKDDLSAQIVFHYLDQPSFHMNIAVVSNDHFDEDGLVSMFAIISPEYAQKHRSVLIDVASAGDFGTYRFRDAARAAFVISAFADRDTSPLNKAIFSQPYPETCASLYEQMLPKLPDILENIDQYRHWWQAEDHFLSLSEDYINSNAIKIEEIPALDLAIVTIPEVQLKSQAHRFTRSQSAWCHPVAIHNATSRFRILLIKGRQYEFQYRYESWVQYVSRRPLARVDLAPLADQLTRKESGGVWKFDGVGNITPRMYLTNAAVSRIDPDDFRQRVTSFLSTAPAAWNPYDQVE